jgi:hypothetical protein
MWKSYKTENIDQPPPHSCLQRLYIYLFQRFRKPKFQETTVQSPYDIL